MSIISNFNQTVDVINTIRNRVLENRQRVMLHFDHIKNLDPPTALLLVAEIYRARNLTSPETVTGTYPKVNEVYNLLYHMGFFKLLEIADLVGVSPPIMQRSQPIWAHFITSNRVVAELADRFVALIEKHIMPLNDLARGKLVGAMVEAMNNTLDHAFPEGGMPGAMRNRWWLSASLNPGDREVRIMFFDHGVGIPETITPELYEVIRAALSGLLSLKLEVRPDDGQLIAAATQLSRTRTGQPGRGRGFDNMKRFVDVCEDGELRVLSNRGWYSYMRGRELHGAERGSIGGTLIEWRFRHSGSVEISDD